MKRVKIIIEIETCSDQLPEAYNTLIIASIGKTHYEHGFKSNTGHNY